MGSHSVVGSRKVGQTVRPMTYFRTDVTTCLSGEVYDTNAHLCRKSVSTPFFNESMLDCANFIVLEFGSFSIQSDGSVVDFASNTTHPQSQYIFLEDERSVLLCSNYSQNFTRRVQETEVKVDFKFSHVQTIVSVVGQVLSILGLTVFLTVYAMLPQLRNLPGLLLMSLATALLLAQLSFLFASAAGDVFAVCVTLAAFTHYFFLASFFCMHVLAFNVWRTFSGKAPTSNDSKNTRRLRMYLLYATVAPLVIVACTLLTNFVSAESAKFNPRIGEGVCWLTNRYALTLFFGLPLLVILLSNLAMFLATARNINRAAGQAQMASAATENKQNIRFAALFAKLALIMGLTWAVAFVATFSELHFVWFIFIILNSLQGFFICCAFVFTRKVVRLMREKARKWRITKRLFSVASHDDVTAVSTRATRTSSSEKIHKTSRESIHSVHSVHAAATKAKFKV